MYLEFEVRRIDCTVCGKVKTEQLDFLADNRFYTKRFAWHVGRRCRNAPISAVAKEFDLDWQTVKSLDKQYMAEQLKRAGMPGPKAIGIDENGVEVLKKYSVEDVEDDATWKKIYAEIQQG